jgi:competence protein ComEA
MTPLRNPRFFGISLVLAAGLFAHQALPVLAAPAPSKRQAEPASQGSGEGVVDINKATIEDLVAVPGLGKSLAQRIVDFREKNGPFGEVDDLLKVQGIGEKSLVKLRPHLTCSKASR